MLLELIGGQYFQREQLLSQESTPSLKHKCTKWIWRST